MKSVLLLCSIVFAYSQSTENVLKNIWSFTGGKSAFEKARYISFDWIVAKDGTPVKVNHHTWDRYTGDYVLSYTSKEKKKIETYFNVNSKKGFTLIDGTHSEDSKYIDEAYESFINDSYWLIVPTKLEDKGVHLSYSKEKELDILTMSFENVGLTPKDVYKLYVTAKGKIVKWTFTLENGRKGEFDWDDYQTVGLGIKFSLNKISKTSPFAIRFENVILSETIDRSVFKYTQN